MHNLNETKRTNVCKDVSNVTIPVRPISEIKTNSERQSTIAVGFRINPDTCHRIVDRGPLSDDTTSSPAFVSLWGERKAQLRRFKDGTINHAVVWNDIENDMTKGRFQLEGGTKTSDIVERIARHIFREHFCKQDVEEMPYPQFSLTNMTSLVEGA